MAALLLAGCGRTNDVPSGDGQIVRSNENIEQENAENLQDKEDELPGSTGEDFLSAQEPSGEDGNRPVVYMTTEISAESLMAVYDALGVFPSGRIAIKLSTGESGSNYLRTDLIGDFVMSFDEPSIVECNTAYGGSRSNAAMHYQVAEDHGYTGIADVDIMDENGSMSRRNIRAAEGWFFMGIVLSALFQRYVPAEVMTDLFGGNQAFGVLMAATIGVPLYACGGGTIPLLQGWLLDGMSMGSAAAFMIAGPATKITNMGAVKIVLGIRRFVIYIVYVILFSLLAGLLVNAVM